VLCACYAHVMDDASKAANKNVSKNLSLAPGIIVKGERLAALDRRSFSSEVEWLIEQEFARREIAVVASPTAGPESEAAA
jgi:hypothetical protein